MPATREASGSASGTGADTELESLLVDPFELPAGIDLAPSGDPLLLEPPLAPSDARPERVSATSY